MRLLLTLFLLAAVAPPVLADRTTFEGGRFSVEIPDGWKKGEGPDDGHQLYRESPKGEGSFSTYVLDVKKDHQADLTAILKSRVEKLQKAGMQLVGDIQGQEQEFDGKKAAFVTLPVEADYAGQKIKFSYYLVLLDATDKVVILQAALPRPADKELREATLAIIQSFREKAKDDR